MSRGLIVTSELQGRQREIANAQARPARARQHVDYQGQGWTTVSLDLGVYFIDEPTFSWGARLIDGRKFDSADLLAPMAVVTKYTYADDHKKYLYQAEIALTANSTIMRYLRFSLTFEGHALRAAAMTDLADEGNDD